MGAFVPQAGSLPPGKKQKIAGSMGNLGFASNVLLRKSSLVDLLQPCFEWVHNESSPQTAILGDLKKATDEALSITAPIVEDPSQALDCLDFFTDKALTLQRLSGPHGLSQRRESFDTCIFPQQSWDQLGALWRKAVCHKDVFLSPSFEHSTGPLSERAPIKKLESLLCEGGGAFVPATLLIWKRYWRTTLAHRSETVEATLKTISRVNPSDLPSLKETLRLVGCATVVAQNEKGGLRSETGVACLEELLRKIEAYKAEDENLQKAFDACRKETVKALSRIRSRSGAIGLVPSGRGPKASRPMEERPVNAICPITPRAVVSVDRLKDGSEGRDRGLSLTDLQANRGGNQAELTRRLSSAFKTPKARPSRGPGPNWRYAAQGTLETERNTPETEQNTPETERNTPETERNTPETERRGKLAFPDTPSPLSGHVALPSPLTTTNGVSHRVLPAVIGRLPGVSGRLGSEDLPAVVERVEPESVVEEGGGDCCICHNVDADNLVVFCDGCDLAVHPSCYGYPLSREVPEGPWLCDRCEHPSPPSANHCSLCPSSEGAMKHTTDWQWAHLSCGFFIPEVFFLGPNGNDYVHTLHVPRVRFRMLCHVCATWHGACVHCTETGCDKWFHVTCGQARGFAIEYRRNKCGRDIVLTFCGAHTAKWEKDKQAKKRFKISSKLSVKKR